MRSILSCLALAGFLILNQNVFELTPTYNSRGALENESWLRTCPTGKLCYCAGALYNNTGHNVEIAPKSIDDYYAQLPKIAVPACGAPK